MKKNIQSSIITERFLYQSPNGMIEGFSLVPKHGNGKAVMVFRGGKRLFSPIDNRFLTWVLTPLTAAGFTVYASQYSGGPNSEGKDEYGGTDVADVHALLDVMRADGVYHDGDFLGALGFSRGAMQACIAMQQGLPITRAAFVGGVYDFRNVAQERPDILAMWKRDDMFDVNDGTLAARSPLSFASNLPNIPYLLLHSEEDDRVPSRQAREIAIALGSNATLKMFPGNDHGLTNIIEERTRLINDFFAQE